MKMIRPSPEGKGFLTILLQAMLALPIALAIWCIPVNTAIFLFDYLYESEFNGVETYSWAPPSLSLFVPLNRITSHVIMKQRLTAGPNYEDTRQLTISTGFSLRTFSPYRLQFHVKGREPRIYAYLIPAFGHAITIDYRIDPLANPFDGDPRSLGFVVFDTAVRYPPQSMAPSWSALALMLFPPAIFVTVLAWSGNRRRSMIVSVILTVISGLLYVYSPNDILLPSVSILSANIVFIVFGFIIRRLMSYYQEKGVNLVIYSLAFMIIPWVYVVTGANIGRYWRQVHPWGSVLMITPIICSLTLLVVQYKKKVGLCLGVISLISVVSWSVNNLVYGTQGYGYDFKAYYEAALTFQSGQSIYDLKRSTNEYFSAYYKYPTFFLFFILPLSRLSFDESLVVFRLVSLIAVFTAVICILQSNRVLNPVFLSLSLLLSLGFSPLHWSLQLGQVDPLILLFIVIAISKMTNKWISPVSWGIVGMIKIYPLFLLFMSLIERKWRYLTAVVASMGVFWAVSVAYFSWENERDFWTMTLNAPGARTARLSNQSIYAVIARLLDPSLAHTRDEHVLSPIANVGHYLFAVVILAVTVRVIWRLRLHVPHIRWEAYSLLICCMLLLMPVAWDHYQTILLIPLLVGLAYTLTHHRANVTVVFILAYALLVFGTFKNIAVNIMPSSIVLFFASYRTFGLLILWAWWVYVLWNWKFCEETSSNA